MVSGMQAQSRNPRRTDHNAGYIGIKSKARDTRNTPDTAQPPMDAENGKLMRESILAAMKR